MKLVFIYLIKTTLEELNNYLSQNYAHDPRIDISEWIDVDDANDPVLYINMMESKSWEQSYGELNEGLNAILGEQPTHVVQIDVSGRHEGDQEVQKCIHVLLSRFSGVVQDEFTDHFWTLQEIQSGTQIEGHLFFDYKGWSVAGIIEHSNDRLTIQEKERVGAIDGWLMLLPGIGVFISSLWFSLPLWVTILSGGWVFLILSVTLVSIWVAVPSLLIFDRITGELTILSYGTRVFARKIEQKKVYLLQDIKDVILVTAESNRGPSDSIQLVIRNKNNEYDKYKRVPIPGSNDYYSIRNEAEVVASFLGLEIKEETRTVRDYDF
jgi:hypothetical protein